MKENTDKKVINGYVIISETSEGKVNVRMRYDTQLNYESALEIIDKTSKNIIYAKYGLDFEEDYIAEGATIGGRPILQVKDGLDNLISHLEEELRKQKQGEK